MKRFKLYAALAGALTLPALALAFQSPLASSATSDLQARKAEKPKATRTFSQLPEAAARPAKAPQRAVIDGNYDPSTLGTPVEVLFEDFSLMTEGEFGDPAEVNMTYSQSDPAFKYPWTNMKPGYCHTDGWGADESTLPAGGMVCLDALNGQAHINTRMTDVSASPLSLLEFKIYADETSAETFLAVEAAETYNMSPTWDMMGNAMLSIPQGEWHTVRMVFFGGKEHALYNIVLMSEFTRVYIDDVRVSTITPFVGVPEVLKHHDYQGTSFLARWTAVEGADKYLVNVYERGYMGQIGDPVHEDLEATTNELTIPDLESGVPYYVEVRAVKGEHVGYPSTPVMIWDLEKPVLNPVSEVKDWKYTASWGEVPLGEVYNYWAYGERKAETDGQFEITKEKYTSLVDHEGERTGWTMDNNEGLSYTEYNVQGGVKQAGWRAKHSAPFDDCLCIDGWWYMVAGEDAGLLSPEMDLSANGGKARLRLRLAGEFLPANMTGYDKNYQVGCAVAVFAWNDAREDYDQVFLTYPEGISPSWKTVTVDLENLTDRCVIGIYAVTGPGNLYVTDIQLTQERKQGDTFLDPFLFARYHNATSIDVTVPPYVSGTDIYHRVGATTSIVESMGMGESVEIQDGGYSDREYVGRTEPSAVKGITTDQQASVSVANGQLQISEASGRTEIFSADGALLLSSDAKVINFQLPNRGTYIVVSGGKTYKAIF